MTLLLPAIADETSEGDRAWFERHPNRHTYVRAFVPGELPISLMAGDGVQCMVVRQIRPGVRMRLPLYLPRMPADTETAARRVLALAWGKSA